MQKEQDNNHHSDYQINFWLRMNRFKYLRTNNQICLRQLLHCYQQQSKDKKPMETTSITETKEKKALDLEAALPTDLKPFLQEIVHQDGIYLYDEECLLKKSEKTNDTKKRNISQ